MSPRGAQSFTRHAAAVEQRQAAALESMGPYADRFDLKGGQIAVVRFLEQGEDLAYASQHRIPVGRQYPQDVLCLDQNDDGTPCPFCASEVKEIRARSTRGFVNIIWRGNDQLQQLNANTLAMNQQRVAQGQPPYMTYTLAPTFKRNQNGFPERDEQTKQRIITGYADGVFLWRCSNTVFNELMNKDGVFRGLMSRDFTVRRQGTTMNDTSYFIEPYDVNTPAQAMSPVDQALANTKYDLDKFITPMSMEDAQKMLSGNVAAPASMDFTRGAGVPGAVAPAMPMPGMGGNPFEQGAPMPASVPAVPPPVVPQG